VVGSQSDELAPVLIVDVENEVGCFTSLDVGNNEAYYKFALCTVPGKCHVSIGQRNPC